MNYFMRLCDTGCRQWGVWEVRAVLLLLAGYSVRDIVAAARNALCRRQAPGDARGLLGDWLGNGILKRWRERVRVAGAAPNDAALVHAALAHRDAVIPWADRSRWVALHSSSEHEVREVPDVGFCRVAQCSRVRFAGHIVSIL